MKFFTKKLEVPEFNETREIDVVDSWVVRWYGSDAYRWGGDAHRAEFFLNEQLAREFAQALTNAFTLLQIKGTNTDIKVTKTSS